MWVVDDKAMEHLLGGDFTDVFVICDEKKDTPISTLYKLQNTYESYQGFRKFFKRHMKPIIENICFIEEESFIGSIIRYFSGMLR